MDYRASCGERITLSSALIITKIQLQGSHQVGSCSSLVSLCTMQLSTSRCLVTGASDPGSIGYACAVALLQAGAAHVTIAGRDTSKVTAAVAQLQTGTIGQPSATTVHGVVADLSQPDQMVGLVQQAATAMGDNRIDILIVSGANGGSEYLGLSSTDPDAYRLLHTISVISPMLLATRRFNPFTVRAWS
jgi:NAD(P)-dependent dehydrogenase (short-subunit alcohol dehydrogenase family)